MKQTKQIIIFLGIVLVLAIGLIIASSAAINAVKSNRSIRKLIAIGQIFVYGDTYTQEQREKRTEKLRTFRQNMGNAKKSPGSLNRPGNKKELNTLVKQFQKEKFDKDYFNKVQQLAGAIAAIRNPNLVPLLCKYAKKGISGTRPEANLYFRVAAIGALGNIKDERAIGTLKDLLSDQEIISCSASTALGNIGNPKVIPAMMDNMTRSNYCSTAGIGMFGKEGLDAILAKVNDPKLSEDESRELKLYIGSIRDPEAKPLLKELYKSKDTDFQLYAGQALLWIAGPEDVDYFINGLEKNEFGEYDRHWAIQALTKIGDPKAIPVLEKTYQESQKGAHDWELAFQGLAKLKGDEFRPEILKYINDKNSEVRKSAIESLQYCKPEEVVNVLVKIIDPSRPVNINDYKDKMIREAAVQTLGKLNSVEAMNAGIRLTKNKNKSISDYGFRVILSLAELNPDFNMTTRKILLDTIADEKIPLEQRSETLYSIKYLLGHEAEPILEKYIKDPLLGGEAKALLKELKEGR